MSNGPDITSIGKTLTNGIQDISALLPLLGTEQCEQHIGSGLTGGYLYVAATPMSIFGSLGMARAGFKGLLASIAVQNWRFVGAEKLRDIGFTPSGKNLSLIMTDPDNGCHLAETRLDSLIKDLHIENVERLSISVSCDAWNIKMLIFTAAFCILGVTPYIHLITNKNNLPRFACWALPVLRALGGFLTATSLQLLIERRLMVVLNNRLRFHAVNHAVRSQLLNQFGDDIPFKWDFQIPSEICLWNLEQVLSSENSPPTRRRAFHALRTALGDAEKENTDPSYSAPGKKGAGMADSTPLESIDSANLESKGFAGQQMQDDILLCLAENFARIKRTFPTNINVSPFLVLMFFGISTSVVGYVGCFTVVQGSHRANAPLIWLCLEGVLSMIRMALWGWNPKFQYPDPVGFTFALNRFAPLSTANMSYEELRVTRYRRTCILPFVRASEFLESITSYAGLLKRFDNPNISLFYTLIRRASHGPEVRERLLYIILFDYREHVTRVYTEDNGDPIFFDTEPLITLEKDKPQGDWTDEKPIVLKDWPLQIIVKGIIDPLDDSLVADEHLRTTLRVHYRSIVDQLQFRIRHPCRRFDVIENTWTLKYADTCSTIGRDAAKQTHHRSRSNMFSQLTRKEDGPQDRISRPEQTVTEDIATSVVTVEERDDVEYAQQGDLRRKRQNIFHTRGADIHYYALDVWLQTAWELRKAISDMDFQQPEVVKLQNLLNQMLWLERVTLEAMNLKEMQEWEGLLFERHRDMSKTIVKNQKDDWGIDMLERRLKEEWTQASQRRLVSDVQRRVLILRDQQTWTSLFLDEPKSDPRVLSLDHLRLKLVSGVERELTVLHQLPDSEQGCVWPLEDLILSSRRSLQTCLNQNPRDMSAASMKFLKEREKAMVHRLSLEAQNLRRRINNAHLAKCFCSLEHNYEGEIGFASIPISTSKQWVRVDDYQTSTKSIKCHHQAPAPLWRDFFSTLQRTGWINILQAGSGSYFMGGKDSSALEILEGIIELIKDKAAPLTTILLMYPVLEKETVAALTDAISENPNILSVGGLDPQLEPLKAVLAQRRLTTDSTSLATYGFYVPKPQQAGKIGYHEEYRLVLYNTCGGGSAKIELRFIGPKKGALILKLRHRQFESSGQAIQIQGKVTLTYPIPQSKKFVTKAIELIPETHFDPGTPVLMSIVPALKGYELESIDLVDEDDILYSGTPNKDPYRIVDDELAWGQLSESLDQASNRSAETISCEERRF